MPPAWRILIWLHLGILLYSSRRPSTSYQSQRADEMFDDPQEAQLRHLGPDLFGEMVGQRDRVDAVAGGGRKRIFSPLSSTSSASSPCWRIQRCRARWPRVDDSSTRTSGKAIKIAPSARKTGWTAPCSVSASRCFRRWPARFTRIKSPRSGRESLTRAAWRRGDIPAALNRACQRPASPRRGSDRRVVRMHSSNSRTGLSSAALNSPASQPEARRRGSSGRSRRTCSSFRPWSMGPWTG